MNQQPDNLQDQIREYQTIVKQYETLDAEIDSLIMRNRGASENMSLEDREHYRQLAAQRTELLNQIRILENELFKDDDYRM